MPDSALEMYVLKGFTFNSPDFGMGEIFNFKLPVD